MGLYLENGYIDMSQIIKRGYPFTIVMNGRGTGKTYGALKHFIEEKKPFIYLRRLQSQIDIIKNPEFDPFVPLEEELQCNFVQVPLSKKASAVYLGEQKDGKILPSGNRIALTAALSTFSSMRGMSAEYIKAIVYDEFIPEWNERPMKEEYYTLKNAIETIGRNRELKGEKPLQLVALANSNNIANPVLMGMGIVNKIVDMSQNGREWYTDERRGIYVVFPRYSPISERKTETSLYRLDGEDNFSKMALQNTFAKHSDSTIKPQPIREYKPLCNVGELAIYQHKSTNIYYITTHKSGTVVEYGVTDVDLERFISQHGYIRRAYIKNTIIFESPVCELLFDKYIHK